MLYTVLVGMYIEYPLTLVVFLLLNSVTTESQTHRLHESLEVFWFTVAEEIDSKEIGGQEKEVWNHQGRYNVLTAAHHQDPTILRLFTDWLQQREEEQNTSPGGL